MSNIFILEHNNLNILIFKIGGLFSDIGRCHSKGKR